MRFLFIDRIASIEREKSARGRKVLAMSEDYFEHHFPFSPVMPGVLMLQALVELSRWLVLYSTDFRFYCLLSTLHLLKIRAAAQPGDVLEAEVDWAESKDEAVLFSGRVFKEGALIADARFENRLVEIADSRDSEALKRSFWFISTSLQGRLKSRHG
jgi:3-hydroxyacyl-[acyl-carrier-protein] dehydratase